MSLIKWLSNNSEQEIVTLSSEDSGKLETAGDHNINSTIDLRGGHNPHIAGDMSVFRSVGSITRAQSFNGREAEKLERQAEEAEARALATKKAYEALERIDTADRKVTETYAKYAINNAQQTAKSATAMTNYHNALHDLRPAYASMVDSMIAHRDSNNHRIQMLKEGLTRQQLRRI